jgi:hypothetical protein
MGPGGFSATFYLPANSSIPLLEVLRSIGNSTQVLQVTVMIQYIVLELLSFHEAAPTMLTAVIS